MKTQHNRGTSLFAEYAPRLYDNGWGSLLPLNGKNPLIPGWPQFNRRPLTETELDDLCRRYPTANVGLPAGNGIVAIDIDVDDPAHAERAQVLADEMLGQTPLIRIGRAPRQVRIYRGTARSGKHHPIEVFGDSGQVVLYGTHPTTQQRYFWPDDEPLHVSPDSDVLPMVSPESISAYIGEAIRHLGRIDRQFGKAPGRSCDATVDLFSQLRAERAGLRGRNKLEKLAQQLARATPGVLHNTLLSVVGALVWAGYPDRAIIAFVTDHFAAPRSGTYAAVWHQIRPAIIGSRRRWEVEQVGEGADL